VTCKVVFDRHLPHARIVRDECDPMRAGIWLSGEIDAECAAALDAELAEHRGQRRRVVRVDTYGVSFIDSAALEVLHSAHHQWLSMRGTLVLIGVTGPTARLLELTGLDRELLSMPPAADMVLAGVGAMSLN